MGQSTGPQLRRREGDYGSDASFAERSFIDNRAGSNAVLRRPAADSNASARMPARPRVQALSSQWSVISNVSFAARNFIGNVVLLNEVLPIHAQVGL